MARRKWRSAAEMLRTVVASDDAHALLDECVARGSWIAVMKEKHRLDWMRGDGSERKSLALDVDSQSWSPAGPRLAVVGRQDDVRHLSVLNVEGGHLARLTATKGDIERAIAWSPDGSRIAFLMDPTYEEEEFPSWWPYEGSETKGNWLATSNVRYLQPYVIDGEGSEPTRLADKTVARRGMWEAGYPLRWSPDGRRILFVGDGAVVTLTAQEAGQKVTPFEVGQVQTAAWSKDGRHIRFLAAGARGSVKSDGTDAKMSPCGDTSRMWEFQWSPEGDALLFLRNRGSHVRVIRWDGSAEKEIFAGDKPAWSPDGTKIAMVSNRTGHLSVIGADGSGETTVTEEGADALAWSPDGRSLAFISTQDRATYSVRLDGSARKQMTGESADRVTWSFLWDEAGDE